MNHAELEAKLIERLKDADPELVRGGRAKAAVNALLPLGWICESIGHRPGLGWEIRLQWCPRNYHFYVRPDGFED